LPLTLVGLVLALLAHLSGASTRWSDGVVEVVGGWLPRLFSRMRLCAITIGHVALFGTPDDHRITRAHERIHVRQCERWGVAFPFAYVIASGIAFAHGRDPYRDNVFEREAFALAPTE
jgi:hypothetical protein